MTKKAHKRFLSKIASKPHIEKKRKAPIKPKPIIDENPNNCTLKIPCPLIERICKGCRHDKQEIKRRKELGDEK